MTSALLLLCSSSHFNALYSNILDRNVNEDEMVESGEGEDRVVIVMNQSVDNRYHELSRVVYYCASPLHAVPPSPLNIPP